MPAYRTVQVKELSTDFRKATEIVEVPELPTATAGHVVVKNHYLGINAADINITGGAYGVRPLPFGCGLEAVGVVVVVGDDVDNVQAGDAVVYQTMGAFSEYVVVPAARLIKVPASSPVLLPAMMAGISASIALSVVGEMKSGENILITSAAGATGQIAVQLAKQAGNHVIGTCSSASKAEVLKKLGVDRVINYSEENMNDVLKAEYPNGVDIVFETVGGETFQTAVKNIAKLGRIIVFGYTSGYKDKQADAELFFVSALNRVLLSRSASVRGFLMQNHLPHYAEHMGRLVKLITEGKIVSGIDPTPFNGLEGIADAIDHMYARKNIGKLVVKLV